MMNPRSSLRLSTILGAVVILAMLASVSLAGTRQVVRLLSDVDDGTVLVDEPTEPCPPEEEPVDDGDVVDEGDEPVEGEEPTDGEEITLASEGEPVEEPTEGDEPVEGEEPTDGEEPTEGDEGEELIEDPCAEDGTEDGDVVEDGDEPPAEPTDEREAACMAAAGLTPDEGGEGDEGTVEDGDGEGKLTGLDNAIQRVLANCIKNPQAPGLLNALEHLAYNKAMHEAREAWKAERKAERELAKAERMAAKAAMKAAKLEARAAGGHGNGGGNGHGPGGGGPPGHNK